MQSHQEMRRATSLQRRVERGEAIEDESGEDEQETAKHSVPKGRTLRVASVSPQSLASFVATLQHAANISSSTSQAQAQAHDPLHPLRLLLRVRHFLARHFDFHHVHDTTFARHVALREHLREFHERREHQRLKKSARGLNGVHATTLPSPHMNGSGLGSGAISSTEGPVTVRPHPGLPMLASACPGWICYAEKTHGELLPYIAGAKSPQQVAGVLAQRYLLPLANRRIADCAAGAAGGAGAGATGGRGGGGAEPPFEQVYHVTVMPCYDKKLEASRQDFADELSGWKEVDCVLTTGELEKLMQEERFDLAAPLEGENALLQAELDGRPPSSPSSFPATLAGDDALGAAIPSGVAHPGSSSGSYLFSLIEDVARTWLRENPQHAKSSGAQPTLRMSTIRTSDYTEYVLRAPVYRSPADNDTDMDTGTIAPRQSTILFKGAQCYGFRNLQNLVRKLHRQTGTRSARGAAAASIDGVAIGQVQLNGSGSGNGDGAAAAGAGARVTGRGNGRGRVMMRRGGMAARRLAGAGAGASGPSSRASTPGSLDGSVANGGGQGEEEEDAAEREYDYVEVMACPSGCVNGGGQLRPPLASKDANAAATDKSEPVAAEKMEVDGALELLEKSHEPPVQGWQGTSKEWVAKVETAYWGSREERDAEGNLIVGIAPKARAQAAFSRSLAAQAADHHTSPLDKLAEIVVQSALQPSAAGSAPTREALLRTQYRALPTEETNGLAVQW